MKKSIVLILSVCLFVCSLFSLSGCERKNDRSVYNLDLTFNEQQMTVNGRLNFEWLNDTENVLSYLQFNAFGNAFRSGAEYFPATNAQLANAVHKGFDYGSMTVNSVTHNDKPLAFELGGTDKTFLTVQLGQEIYPDERFDIVIDYELKLPKIAHRTGFSDNTVNLGNCYPTLAVYDNGFYECLYYNYGDPFYSNVADYNVTLSAPKNYVVASSGTLVSSETEQSNTVNRYTLENARDFAMVLSTKFKVLSEKVGEVDVNYYYFNDQTPNVSLEYAVNAVKTFENLFGKYAYPSLAVVETDFLQGGMEYPGLVYISSGLDATSYREVVVHETAHQWWYAGVGNNEIEHAFLDEGLVEYSVVTFFENNPQYNQTREEMMQVVDDTYKTYYNVLSRLDKGINTVMNRALKDFNSEYEYVSVAYIKGCLFFDNLRESVGDKRFFDGLKKYYENYCFKNATPDDFASIFTKSGAIPESYFENWFNGKVIM